MEQFIDYLKTLLEQSEPLSTIKTWVESGCVIPEKVGEETSPTNVMSEEILVTEILPEETPSVIEETSVTQPVVEETPATVEETSITEPVVEETTVTETETEPVIEETTVTESVVEETPVTVEQTPTLTVAPVQTTTIPVVPTNYKFRFGRRNRF